MKLAFTICSNNYLAFAKTFGDSLLKHNPNYRCIIVLVDRKSPRIDYEFLGHEIIEIEDIGIEDFVTIWKKFNIVELNTAVKPCLFKYFLAKYPEIENLFYFDPDIMIYDSLENLENYFNAGDILLTPHALSPIDADPEIRLVPSDSTFCNHGVYNLGFIGLKAKSKHVEAMLSWWEKRTLSEGYIDVCNGLFVDQLWINLAPIYFERVVSIKEMRYNVAPWNLHERGHIKSRNGQYFLPDDSALSFFHFSSYKYTKPAMMAKYYNRFNFLEYPEIKPLYDAYHALLLSNKIDLFSQEPCYFVEMREKFLTAKKIENKKKIGIGQKLKKIAKALTPPLIWTAIKKTSN